MRKIIFTVIISILSIHCSFCQEMISFSKVINVDSTSKSTIYNGVKEWIAINFVSSKNVIDLDDKDEGLIIINTLTGYSYGKISYVPFDGYLNYTIKIQIKDNRFKIEFTNFTHKVDPASNDYWEYWSIGLITNSELCNKGKGLNKKQFENVWIDLKTKSSILATGMIAEIAKIKFENKNNNW